jgi:hypothetical protein
VDIITPLNDGQNITATRYPEMAIFLAVTRGVVKELKRGSYGWRYLNSYRNGSQTIKHVLEFYPDKDLLTAFVNPNVKGIGYVHTVDSSGFYEQSTIENYSTRKEVPATSSVKVTKKDLVFLEELNLTNNVYHLPLDLSVLVCTKHSKV